VLGFVAHDQTNISADSLGVAIEKPFREVLAPAALYICVLDRLHFDIVWLDFLERSQIRISNQVPIPEPIIGEYKAPSVKPIIATRINSAPATPRTLLRIVFNAVQKDNNFSDVIVFPAANLQTGTRCVLKWSRSGNVWHISTNSELRFHRN